MFFATAFLFGQPGLFAKQVVTLEEFGASGLGDARIYDVSADGSVAVGDNWDNKTAIVMVGNQLTFITGMRKATAVSDDGNIVSGWIEHSKNIRDRQIVLKVAIIHLPLAGCVNQDSEQQSQQLQQSQHVRHVHFFFSSSISISFFVSYSLHIEDYLYVRVKKSAAITQFMCLLFIWSDRQQKVAAATHN